MSAVDLSLFNRTFPAEQLKIRTAAPVFQGSLSYSFDTESERGSAWIDLDSRFFAERLFQIVALKFFDRYATVSPEIRPSLDQNVIGLDFLLHLQRIANNTTEYMTIPEFKAGTEGLLSLLKLNAVSIDECLPDFLLNREQILERLERNGEKLVRKEDLFPSKDDDLPLASSMGGIDGRYGSEQVLLFRMGMRFSNFISSSNLAARILQSYALRSALDLQEYLTAEFEVIKVLYPMIEIPPKVHEFLGDKLQELETSHHRKVAFCKRMFERYIDRSVGPISPMITALNGVSDGNELREKLRVLLPTCENLKNGSLRLYHLYEDQFFELQETWKEASALLLFFLSNLQNLSKISSPNEEFKRFLQEFNQNQQPMRTAFFNQAYPLEIKAVILRKYLETEKLRLIKSEQLSMRIDRINLFCSSINLMEATLTLYHQSHRYFLDQRRKVAAELQLTRDLRTVDLALPTSGASSSSNRVQADSFVVDDVKPITDSSTSSSNSALDVEIVVHDATTTVVNKQAKAAIYNAITLLDDLLTELNTTIRSNKERIEHLDYLLVNLSLCIEQLLSFKVLEKINPRSREQARPYLLHNLFHLCNLLPDELKGERTIKLAEALNGAENFSRSSFTAEPSDSHAVKLLTEIHSLPTGEECDFGSSLELQRRVYLFVKQELENAFEILFQRDIATDKWVNRWNQLLSSQAYSTPSSEKIPSMFNEESHSLLERIDRVVGKCQQLSFTSNWLMNATRLLRQLKARVEMTQEVSDLEPSVKRTAGLICLVGWSLCIASAAKDKKIDLQNTHISTLSKNLWDWVDPVLGQAGVDSLTPGEETFCDLSKTVYYQNRYQHSSNNTNFPLWRIGFDSREEELAFASSIKREGQLVTLGDGLTFIERILQKWVEDTSSDI